MMRTARVGIALGALLFGALLANAATVFAAPDWTQLFPAHSPSARENAAMAQYGDGSKVILFGGVFRLFTLQQQVFKDSWIWNGSDWSQFTSSLATPPARYGASMAYDPVAGVAVMFGGQDASGNFLSDTWLFHGTLCKTGSPCVSPFWQNVTAFSSTHPSPRVFAGMAYSPIRQRIVLLGGTDATAFTGGVLTDTWEFNTATNSWVQPLVEGSVGGGPLAQCSSTGFIMSEYSLDPFDFPPPFQDVWNEGFVYPGPCTTRFCTLNWGIVAVPFDTPLPRFPDQSGMAYYPVAGNGVRFGGETNTDSTNDTWNGKCVSNTTISWTFANPAHVPVQRARHAMTTGPNGLTVLMFGGLLFGQTGFDQSDTWVWGLRAACNPLDGSEIPPNSKVSCEYTPAEGLTFDGWEATGFAPGQKQDISPTFEAVSPGPASITAHWTDADGQHSSTLNYTIGDHSAAGCKPSALRGQSELVGGVASQSQCHQ